MKRPHRKLNVLRELGLLSLPLLALAGFAWYAERRPVERDVASLLIGEWKVKNSRESWMTQQNMMGADGKEMELTSFALFRSNGTYEAMASRDALSNSATHIVWKGRYAVAGNTVKIDNLRRFYRPHRRDEGLDKPVVFKPCTDIGCSGEWDAYDYEQHLAKEGTSFTIVRANWKAQYFVTEPIVRAGDSPLVSKQASWIKHTDSP